MEFIDVRITHKRGNKPEFGKGLLCSYLDQIENKKNVLIKIAGGGDSINYDT